MRFLDSPSRLVIILGPTAVGKTEISLRLAEDLNGEIVSADSRLLYRGMDIGTAKPSREEMDWVRHHLVDVSDPDDTWSLSRYQEAARTAIEDIQQRGKLPMLVGGTGQYIHALTQGWEIPAQEPDEGLRFVLENLSKQVGAWEMHRKLRLLDPKAAEVIQYQNVRRTIRAFEVIFLTGRRFSEQRGKSECPFTYLQIGLKRPRSDLYQRIDMRIDAMLEAGLENETRLLLQKGYESTLPALSAIGYREMIACLEGKISLDEAVMWMRRLTRQFVRRQANWFKENDPRIDWFDAVPGVEKAIEKLISSR